MCKVALTQDKYKKGRTVCKLCYNNHVLAYYGIKNCSSSSSKSDAKTQTDFSNKQDSSNKQTRSSKPDSLLNNLVQINKIDPVNKLVQRTRYI